MKKIKAIKEILKYLYLKMSCVMCCHSKCQIEVGKPDNTVVPHIPLVNKIDKESKRKVLPKLPHS